MRDEQKKKKKKKPLMKAVNLSYRLLVGNFISRAPWRFISSLGDSVCTGTVYKEKTQLEWFFGRILLS